MCARCGGAWLTVNCRSWSGRWLRLVVRYVTHSSSIMIACNMLKKSTTSYLPPEGYHVPAVRHRDAFYQKLEDERAAALGQK